MTDAKFVTIFEQCTNIRYGSNDVNDFIFQITWYSDIEIWHRDLNRVQKHLLINSIICDIGFYIEPQMQCSKN